MGLFDDANTIEGGSFYRVFSQSIESPDINTFFPNSGVAQSGICAGASVLWIRHYLYITPQSCYSNSNLLTNRDAIIAIQKAARFRDQSLHDLLLKCGMKLRPYHFDRHEFDLQGISETAHLMCVSEGVSIISYNHPVYGRHVTTSYVDRLKKTYIFQTQTEEMLKYLIHPLSHGFKNTFTL